MVVCLDSMFVNLLIYLSMKILIVPLHHLNVESCDIWHRRLGHVNFGTIRRLINLDLIPKSKVELGSKCQICVQTKLPKKPFQHINPNSDLLNLIHSDICDSCRTPISARNQYFITFIDDNSRFCYTYLIKSKDEALGKFMIFKAET